MHRHTKEVPSLSRKRLINGIEMLRHHASSMTDEQFRQHFSSEIWAPLCEQLDVLYSPKMEELADVKRQLDNILGMILSLVSNSANLHYLQVYKPQITQRLQGNEADLDGVQIQLDLGVGVFTPLEEVPRPEPVANRNSSTKLRGVKCHKAKYTAHIWHKSLRRSGKQSAQMYLGTYPDATYAAFVRDAAARDLFGEKALLNFPALPRDLKNDSEI